MTKSTKATAEAKGFFVTWTIVVAAHLTSFLGLGFADLLPHPEQVRAIFSLLVLALVPAHVVVPGLVAIVYSMMRRTSSR
ncbi:hypothetical protein [Stenotrophomonas geniculata]|uniref:hypothetical protein n=1 Tax=Stenotrophomonas geniculata TaxID=86188 RepID=UPI000710C1A3|nr:hypothetical protein [Stenotrophomonas geniculata]KRG47075.1 hypothetical protein ARC63_04945 [Stenotrophomonas geniculata ATCC 19374 = JCM 13324]MBH1851450.1 hypothetical protein [Stenotrophomonas maltophilia]MCR1803734.1 hypothetical protein [Stenotrophomonas geniculata]